MVKPKITIYSEVSIDGKTALKTGGDSIEMMSLESVAIKKFRHSLRSNSDAILVGARTVLLDNPKLTVRHVEGSNPLRIVLAPFTKLPLSSTVFSDGFPTLLFTTKELISIHYGKEIFNRTVNVESIEGKTIDLISLTTILYNKYGIRNLMVEGGAQTISTFIREDMVDEIILQTLPHVFGGSAPTFCGGKDPSSLKDTWKFYLQDVQMIDQHVVQRYSRCA